MNSRHFNRMPEETSEQGEDLASKFAQCKETAQDTFEENPMLATLLCFGVGLGIGAMIGTTIAAAGTSRRQTAETIGRRVLASITDLLPESVQHTFR